MRLWGWPWSIVWGSDWITSPVLLFCLKWVGTTYSYTPLLLATKFWILGSDPLLTWPFLLADGLDFTVFFVFSYWLIIFFCDGENKSDIYTTSVLLSLIAPPSLSACCCMWSSTSSCMSKGKSAKFIFYLTLLPSAASLSASFSICIKPSMSCSVWGFMVF